MRWGIVAGLLAGALWGVVFVVPRMTPALSSLDLASGRFLAYGAMSAAVLLLMPGRRRRPTLSQMAWALGLSVLGFTGYYWLLVLAIRDAGTEVPTLIIGTIPLWIMLLGRPAGLRWSALGPGLVLTAAGLALMMGESRGLVVTQASPHPDYLRGIGYAVAAMVSWTAFGLLNAAWLHRHPEVAATDWANWLGVATGGGALLLWAMLGTPLPQLAAHPDFAAAVLICLVTGLGSAWLATILWNIASQRLPASLCGQLIVSETLFALVYSFGWDGQWPTWTQVAACVLFTAGIVSSIRAHR
ncbi:MAG: DMT family transporter [Burkholderiaceae bacterium]|nr:DMT family transporter [Burkholderiaceae bacterium]